MKAGFDSDGLWWMKLISRRVIFKSQIDKYFFIDSQCPDLVQEYVKLAQLKLARDKNIKKRF